MSSSRGDAGARGAATALLLVLALVAAAFAPCLGNGFVDWDDEVNLTANPVVQSLTRENLATILFTTHQNAYHPLPFLAWAAGFRLWGAEPFGHHLTSLVLHLAAAAAVFRWVLLLERSVAAAAVAALLFGAHPMRVESVAWLSDLKDVLAGLFFVAALLAYERWARGRRPGWYAAALGAFLLAGASKTTAVALPLVLLLQDHLQGRRIDRRSLVEKLPFFALAALFAALAVVARGRFEEMIARELSLAAYPAAYRVYVAGHRLVFYFLQRTVAPTTGIPNLFPDVVGGPYLPGALAWGGVLVAFAAAVALSARRTRAGLFGAGFFLLTLAPSLAMISYGYTADRFSYLPSVGLAYLAGVAVAAALRSLSSRPVRAGVVAACLVAVVSLVALSRQQCGVWKDSVSLWGDAVARYREVPPSANLGGALANLGRARLAAGDARGALADLDEALPLTPDRPNALRFRALALAALGEPARAAADLREALRLAPGDAAARELLEALEAAGGR